MSATISRYASSVQFLSSINQAHQRSESARIIQRMVNPLSYVTDKISFKFAEVTYAWLEVNTPIKESVVERLTDSFISKRERTIKALDLAEGKVVKFHKLCLRFSQYDPTQLMEILALLSEDLSLNIRDAKTLVKAIQTFHSCLQKIHEAANQEFGSALDQWNEEQQQNLKEHLEKSLKENEEIYSQGSEQRGYLSSLWASGSHLASNLRHRSTSFVKSVGMDSLAHGGKELLKNIGALAISKAAHTEKDIVHKGMTLVVDKVGKKVLFYSFKTGLETLFFYTANWTVNSILVSESASTNFIHGKTIANLASMGLMILYYGSALHQWKKERETTIRHVGVLAETAQGIILSSGLHEFKENLQSKLTGYISEERAQFKALNSFAARCEAIVEEEYQKLTILPN